MSIGKNIAKYRKIRNLTQEELGAKLGVTNQAVSKWESEVSMPDVMLLPELANALHISLEDIYGIPKEPEKVSISADDFPAFCYKKLIEHFYHNTEMKSTHVASSDKAQRTAQIQKLMKNCRVGCFSNDQGAIVATEDFAFLDCTYKAAGSENIIKSTSGNILSCLSVECFQKAFSYQYKKAFETSKTTNTEFTFEEMMKGCDFSREETETALYLLKATNINEISIDEKNNTAKYVFLISNALYAHAIYQLVKLLAEDAAWAALRDTSLISDYAVEK